MGDAEFGAGLRAACPEVEKKYLSLGPGLDRKNHYVGISLRAEEPEQEVIPF